MNNMSDFKNKKLGVRYKLIDVYQHSKDLANPFGFSIYCKQNRQEHVEAKESRMGGKVQFIMGSCKEEEPGASDVMEAYNTNIFDKLQDYKIRIHNLFCVLTLN